MFIGHFGLGMAARRAAPRPSLGTLLLAAQFVDLLWPTMLLLGLEQVAIEPGATRMTPLHFVSYPYTHSLLAVVGWGFLFGAVYAWMRRDRRGAVVLGLLVVSHWVLDLLVHRPDLPLYPDGPRVGLGLWNLPAVALPLELLLYVAGVWLYMAATRARDRTGRWAFWGLVGFLLLVHLSNLTGPPPPDPVALAWFAQLQWLVIPWAYWIDAHRDNRP